MKKQRLLEGTVKRNPDGFGFLIPDDPTQPDLYIPKHSMTGVMTNDKVMVEVFPEPGGHRFRGEILKITKRAATKVVGAFTIVDHEYGVIFDEGKAWGHDLKIPLSFSKNAKTNDLVAVEIKSYPPSSDSDDDSDNEINFWGVVTEVIGNAEDPMTDIKRVLISQHIPHEFHPKTLSEAEQFPAEVTEKDFSGRNDLRHLNFITIDGATAKDFDDAIYVEQKNDGFILYVAIADVSHYVKLGTQLDMDAYERGTSVYFPNFVVPMLPEALSNELCSLKPNVPRLSLVAEMKFDFTGEMMDSHFYEAVIESKARVTYGEAQEIVDETYNGKSLLHVKKEIIQASHLAKLLMGMRFKNGSLDLEIPDTQIILDGAGVPIDIIKSERLFAHRLIEEMMLAANVAVAKFLSSKDITSIYRIHEPPKSDSIAILEKYMEGFGSRTKLKSGGLQKKLTKALQEFEGKPEAQVLNILTLRSMSQAKYSSENVGHFGLGFEFYTHFTSPIRRYPDLIVHRLLKSQIMPYSGYDNEELEDLQTAANMLSACEQRAVKSERQFVSIKKARFMQKHIGGEFEGIISSVTKFGVFVLLREFEVDGLVRVASLSKEKMEFDEEKLVLYSRRSGLRFSLGDVLKICVVNADPILGQIDFELAGKPIEKFSRSADETALDSFSPPKRKQDHRSDHRKDYHQDHRSNHRSGHRNDKYSEKYSDQQKDKLTGRHSDKHASKHANKYKEKSSNKSFGKHPEKQHRQNQFRSAEKPFGRPVEKEKFSSENSKTNHNPSSGSASKSGFDPAAHFEKVLGQWKERNPHITKKNKSKGSNKYQNKNNFESDSADNDFSANRYQQQDDDALIQVPSFREKMKQQKQERQQNQDKQKNSNKGGKNLKSIVKKQRRKKTEKKSARKSKSTRKG